MSLRLRGLARDLRDDVAGLDGVAVVDDDVRADRAGGSAPRASLFGSLTRVARLGVLERDARAAIRGLATR